MFVATIVFRSFVMTGEDKVYYWLAGRAPQPIYKPAPPVPMPVMAWEYGDNDPADPEQNWDEDNGL